MAYSKVYRKPYAEWKDLPDKTTPVTAAIKQNESAAFMAIENELVANYSTFALTADAGYSLALSVNTLNYVMTLQLKNKAGTVLDTKTVDFPIESMVVGASYANGKLTLTLQNGQTLVVDISDIVSGLVSTSFTIAGIDLEDDITAAELLTALGVEAGAQENVIETIKVNGETISPVDKTVDIEIDEAVKTYEGSFARLSDAEDAEIVVKDWTKNLCKIVDGASKVQNNVTFATRNNKIVLNGTCTSVGGGRRILLHS